MSLLIRLSDDCRFFLAFILVVSSSSSGSAADLG